MFEWEYRVVRSCRAKQNLNQQSILTILLDLQIDRMLSKFNMEDANAAPTPVPPKHTFVKNQNPGEAKDKPYRSLIGSLLYAALGTRPDIAQAVSVLAQFNENPSQEHWTGAKRILRYLKGTRNQGLFFRFGTGQDCKVKVEMYSDAKWAENKDTRKSRSGMVVLVNDTPVAWHSKVQPTHAMSSCESELIALCEVIKEALWFRNFLNELKIGYNDPIPLNVDNKSAIALAKDPVNNNRSKHIDLRYKFLCGHVEAGLIVPIYVPTGENIADLFTKSTSVATFRKLVLKLVE